MGSTAVHVRRSHCPTREAVKAGADRWSRAIVRAGLLASMVLAATALWTAVPAGSLWVTGTLVRRFPEASAGVIPIALSLMIVQSFGVVRVLGALTEAYEHRGTGPNNTRVVEIILVASVVLAAAVLATWTFAHGCPSGRCIPGP